jgi:hypothetical protein
VSDDEGNYAKNAMEVDSDCVSLGEEDDELFGPCPPTPQCQESPEMDLSPEELNEWWNRNDDAKYQAFLRGEYVNFLTLSDTELTQLCSQA